MARQRTGYPNWQGNCNNENFALFSCCEARMVEKKQSSQFSKQSLSFLTCPISKRSEKFGYDCKGAIAVQASKIRFLQKIKRVALLTWCSSFAIRNSLKPLLLQIERSQLRWFGHVSRMSQEKLPNKLYLPKQTGTKTVGRPRTTLDESILH